MNNLINKLKENIFNIVDSVCENSLNENKVRKEIEELEEILSLCQKSSLAIKSQQLNPFYHKLFFHLKSAHDEAIRIKDRKEPTLKKGGRGNTRISYEVSFFVLKAITFCETYKQDMIWLQSFLAVNGELDKYVINRNGEDLVKLPYTKTDERWLYKLKETIMRNLFSVGEVKINKAADFEYDESKRIFYEMVEPLNKELYEEYVASLKD